MPSFNSMREHYNKTSSIIGHQIKDISNRSINETFSNSTTYRKGMIYDCNLKPIKEMEFRFLKTKTYTMEKDAVEYMIMFRPMVNPEIDFDESEDKKHRLGYYIDIYDDNTKKIEKWLIVGKDSGEFDKYNVLKCNWEFEWLDENRIYHKTLGCVRDRNSYNSGIWSDGFFTSVENQTAFIVPSNPDTDTIDYGIRFMITDNFIHPKTYEATKLMDTFPLGTLKVTLGQSHYNEHTDLCERKYIPGIDDINDEISGTLPLHMICDYYESPIEPVVPKGDVVWKLDASSDKIRAMQDLILVKAISNDETLINPDKWKVYIDGDEQTDFVKLSDYVEFNPSDLSVAQTDTISIKIKSDIMIGYIIKISICDINDKEFDSIEMEVIDG